MASQLPDYVAAAQPVPQSSRVAWYKSTAQTYAGIMLWFVFWQDVPRGPALDKALPMFSGVAGGTLAQGIFVAFVGLILAALLCHFLYYLVPGLLGMKTGLPLYIVGTSTYGVLGGFVMPGFLMGLLQFGWLSVNAFFSGLLIVGPFYESLEAAALTPLHMLVSVIWAIAAAFMGLKGIQYVARVATFFPLIPLIILLVLFFATVGSIGQFDPAAVGEATGEVTVTGEEAPRTLSAGASLSTWGVIAVLMTYILGFFATAGAAGTDFGMNNRDGRDVQLGGLVGIALATFFAGGLSLLIVAGAYGAGKVPEGFPAMQTAALMGNIMGSKMIGDIFFWLLAVAAFPAACFAAFIAANSFKATLPKVNPFVSVGLGTIVSIILAVTGVVADVIPVFELVGASFGPICGAMAADYLLAGRKWPGPRAGFNLAGWISWAAGFIIGAANFIPGLAGNIPVPPLMAFVLGFALYYVLARLGLESQVLEMPATTQGTTSTEAGSAPEPA